MERSLLIPPSGQVVTIHWLLRDYKAIPIERTRHEFDTVAVLRDPVNSLSLSLFLTESRPACRNNVGRDRSFLFLAFLNLLLIYAANVARLDCRLSAISTEMESIETEPARGGCRSIGTGRRCCWPDFDRRMSFCRLIASANIMRRKWRLF